MKGRWGILGGFVAGACSFALISFVWLPAQPVTTAVSSPPEAAEDVAAVPVFAPEPVAAVEEAPTATVGPYCSLAGAKEECGGPGADCGCTTITVGKAASADGSVITSHTCDGWYDAGLKVVPAADHKPGTMVSIEKNMLHADQVKPEKVGEIPQVRHTYQYFHIGYPIGNEHQVLIGEDTIGGDPRLRTTELHKGIMWIEHLEMLCLQRTKNARDCVKTMGALAEKYGYIDAGEGLTVTDPNEAWIFEIYPVGPMWTPDSGKPGAVWCAARLPDDSVFVRPNMSRLDEINIADSNNYMCSSNYLDLAAQQKMYDPAAGQPFSWRNTYGAAWRANKASSFPRLWRAFSVLAPKAAPTQGWVMEHAPDFPTFVKPDKKVTFQDVIALFRDTLAGTPYDNTANPAWFIRTNEGFVKSPLATPQLYGDVVDLMKLPWYRPISGFYNSYHFVSQARGWLPNAVGGVFWFGLDNSENSVLVPVYVGNTSTPPSWARANRNKVDRSSAWWAFGLVDDLVNYRWGQLKPMVNAVRDPLQQELFDKQASIEQQAAELYKKDPRAARDFLTKYTNAAMGRAEKAYWELVDKLMYELNNNRRARPNRPNFMPPAAAP
ncbi:MAG TPA: C69 family dipeptidase [Gemmatimonadales bacterium]|nr:C69 family dipeptidase [Gemmatimonadales bacterium]